MPLKTNEDDEQAAFISHLELLYPKLAPLCHHSPNAGKRSWWAGKRLIRLGMKAGWPDLFIAYPHGSYHGLFIELKINKNKLTAKQSEMMLVLGSQGYSCHVCYGAKEAMDCVKSYLRF